MDAHAGSRIAIDNVTVGYGTRPVQSGISARIEKGEVFAIVGDSGSGKSTLMKTMAGLIPAQSGQYCSMVTLSKRACKTEHRRSEFSSRAARCGHR